MNINKKLIEVLKDKTICWYPSAGEDFRPLLYLSEQYVSTRDAIKNISPLPELFVFTDYHNSYFDSNYKGLKALSEGTLRKGDYLFDDSVRGTLHFDCKNTKIKVLSIKKIDIDISEFDHSLAGNEPSARYGTGYLMDVQIMSTDKTRIKNNLGTYDMHILYIFAENSAFAEIFLRESIRVDFLLRIRYGVSFGGSRDTDGEWLKYAAPKLGVKYFLEETDLTGILHNNDRKIIQKLSDICGSLDTKWEGEEIRCTPWSRPNRTIEVSWKKQI